MGIGNMDTLVKGSASTRYCTRVTSSCELALISILVTQSKSLSSLNNYSFPFVNHTEICPGSIQTMPSCHGCDDYLFPSATTDADDDGHKEILRYHLEKVIFDVMVDGIVI